MKKKKKKIKTPILEKAVAAWLKYDPFVKIAVRNDDEVRRDVMLNLLGSESAIRHFGKFPPRKHNYGPILPQMVREAADEALKNPEKRTHLIKKMIYWATDPGVNNRYIKSYLTRIQIITSLLGPLFIHADAGQEDLILNGLKYMLVRKTTALDDRGEQSFQVHEAVLDRVAELLIHNQKVIIGKAIAETEEKMRVHLLKQIQEIKGKKTSTIYSIPELQSTIGQQIIKEKFPLRKRAVNHLEEILEFYLEGNFPELRMKAEESYDLIREIRKPLTLTSETSSR
jgi:hypothetical protein